MENKPVNQGPVSYDTQPQRVRELALERDALREKLAEAEAKAKEQGKYAVEMFDELKKEQAKRIEAEEQRTVPARARIAVLEGVPTAEELWKEWINVEACQDHDGLLRWIYNRLAPYFAAPVDPTVCDTPDTAGWREKVQAAHYMVSALCKPRGSKGGREWIMSIPAQPDHDPDLVITAGLIAAENRIKELESKTPIATPEKAEAEYQRLKNGSENYERTAKGCVKALQNERDEACAEHDLYKARLNALVQYCSNLIDGGGSGEPDMQTVLDIAEGRDENKPKKEQYNG